MNQLQTYVTQLHDALGSARNLLNQLQGENDASQGRNETERRPNPFSFRKDCTFAVFCYRRIDGTTFCKLRKNPPTSSNNGSSICCKFKTRLLLNRESRIREERSRCRAADICGTFIHTAMPARIPIPHDGAKAKAAVFQAARRCKRGDVKTCIARCAVTKASHLAGRFVRCITVATGRFRVQ